jgi:asparagine synthase (glutamine-hydrolysing)
VLHAGEGADEIFSGYEKYQRFRSYHQRMWQPLATLPAPAHRLLFSILRQFPGTRCRKMADTLRRLARGQELLLSSSVAYYEHEKQSVLSRDFQQQCRNTDSFDQVEGVYRRMAEIRADATFLEKLTFLELQLRLPELLLMRVDKMSMLNSVEVRVPFLDRDLVDFALSVPESFKLLDGVAKEPVKRLAANFGPRHTVYRRKSGFGVPIQEWFRSRLGADMREQLEADRDQLERWFNVDELTRRIVQQPRSVNDAFQLWVVYNFMQWRHSFFDQSSASADAA